MKTLKEYTDYLLNCRFTDDAFDPEDHEEHLRASWELFADYPWEEIYPVWMQYLHTKCETPADVINFVNLYIYYEAAAMKIPDPLDFISYLYYQVDMEKYWNEAGELFEGLAITVLSNHNLIHTKENPYYDPTKDERILSRIAALKSSKNSHSLPKGE